MEVGPNRERQAHPGRSVAVKGASDLFSTVALAPRARMNFRCVVVSLTGFGLQGIWEGVMGRLGLITWTVASTERRFIYS